MIDKKYDIKVKVGSYTKAGQTKAVYKTIGTILPGDNGHPFMLLDAAYLSMQLLALANPDNKDKIVCSMFEPYSEQRKPTEYSANFSSPNERSVVKEEIIDDEIPF